MNIFTIRNGKLELDSDEILLIKEFARIYENDKTEKKLDAFKKFKYIYQICDYKSLPNQEGFNDKEAHSFAVEVADLDINYKPEADVKAAIKIYKRIRYNVLRESVLELKRSFKTIIQVIASARKRLEDNLDSEDANNETVTASIDIIAKLLSLSNSLNSQIKTLSETLRQIHKEEEKAKESEIRGDKEFSESLDGDPDIEDF